MLKKIALLLLTAVCPVLSGAKVVTFKYADEVERSASFRVSVNGKAQTVLATQEPDFCVFDCDTPVTVSVRWHKPASEVAVRPLSLDYSQSFENGVLTLTMKPKDRVVVEFDGDTQKPLFIFANEIDRSKPSKKDPDVRYYQAGKVYVEENLNLKSGQTMYIEGGAVVCGNIKTSGADNVTLAGSGIFDSRKYIPKAVSFVKCSNLKISAVTVLNSRSWCTYIAECRGIDIDNYKVIAEYNYWHKRGVENDALDLISSSDARIAHCLTYCHDDAYCLKSGIFGHTGKTADVSYEDCIAWNVRAGNSIEIGHAVCEDIENVSYRNIYSIHRRGNDKVGYWNSDISIHCTSRGHVRNVSYENIYLEESDNYVFSIGVFNNGSKLYGPVYTPGGIENVSMKNIFLLYEPPCGCQFFGYDEEHDVKNLTIENLFIKGEKVTSLERIGAEVSHATVKLL